VASKGSSVEDVWNWQIATLFLLSSLPLPTKADILLNAARGRAASLPRSGLVQYCFRDALCQQFHTSLRFRVTVY